MPFELFLGKCVQSQVRDKLLSSSRPIYIFFPIKFSPAITQSIQPCKYLSVGKRTVIALFHNSECPKIRPKNSLLFFPLSFYWTHLHIGYWSDLLNLRNLDNPAFRQTPHLGKPRNPALVTPHPPPQTYSIWSSIYYWR